MEKISKEYTKLSYYILILLAVTIVLVIPTLGVRVGKELIMKLSICSLLIWFLPSILLKIWYGMVIGNYLYHLTQGDHIFMWITLGLVLYTIAYHYVNEKHLINVLCSLNIFCVAYSLIQYFGLDPIFTSPFPMASFSNPNILGAFIAITGILFLEGKWRYVCWIPWIGLYLASSTTPVIAYTVGSFYYVFRKYDKIYSLMVGMTLIAIVCLDTDINQLLGKEGERYKNWRDTFKMQFMNEKTQTRWTTNIPNLVINVVAVKRPWLGYGLGGYYSNSVQHYFGRMDKYDYNAIATIEDGVLVGFHSRYGHRYAHNDWLQLLFMMGIVGFIPIMLFYVSLLSSCGARRGTIIPSAIVGIGVNCMGHFVMFGIVAFPVILLISCIKFKKQLEIIDRINL